MGAIKTATKGIEPGQIVDSSIGYRHVNGTWKLVTHYQEASTLNTSALTSNKLILPLSGAPVETVIGLAGCPVLVLANMTVATDPAVAAARTQISPAIYVDGGIAGSVDVSIDTGDITTVNLFHMFESTQHRHLIEIRALTSPLADVIVYNRRLQVIAVRTG